MKTILCIVFFLSSSILFAGTRHPDVSDEKVITYGEKFIHTVIITGLTNDDATYIGSGVAIEKNVILTAAHVVCNAKNGIVGIPENKKIWQIKHAILHSDFQFKNFGKFDIAILIIDGSMDFKWYPKLYSGDDELNKVCSVSGYGSTGTFQTGVSKNIKPKRRAGSNVVDEIFRHLLVCDASKDKNTSLEYLINTGDSGGPLYIDNKIAGIHSGVIAKDKNPEGSYGDQSGHTRVSIFNDWILRNMKPYLDKR